MTKLVLELAPVVVGMLLGYALAMIENEIDRRRRRRRDARDERG